MKRFFVVIVVLIVLVAGDSSAQQCPEVAGRWPYGATRSPAIDGTTVYYVFGSVVRIMDVTSAENPEYLGEFVMADIPRVLAASDGIVYASSGDSYIHIIDATDPQNPHEIAAFETTGWVNDATIADDLLYIAAHDAGLFVLDVRDPINPVEVEHIVTSHDAGLVTVAGHYAYVAEFGSGFAIVDVEDPANSLEVAWFSVMTADIEVVGNHVFIADFYEGFHIIDVSDPESPEEVGRLDTPAYLHEIEISGSYAFLNDSKIRTVDITDPTNPQLVAVTDFYLFDLVVAGDRAYAISSGLEILDISDPTSPQRIGFVEGIGSSLDIAAASGYAYVADSDITLRVLSVADPSNPHEIGKLPGPGGAYDVVVNGGFVYLANGESGLRILDISDPSNPHQVANVSSPGSARSVAIANGYAYVADYDAGVLVVDVSNPLEPKKVGRLDTSYYPTSIAVEGDYALVIASNELLIINVQNPVDPYAVSTIDVDKYSCVVTVHSGYAFVAGGGGILRVFDVSDVSNPSLVGSAGPTTASESVVVSGNSVYLADESNLWVFDVEDRTNPRLIEEFDLPGPGGRGWGEGRNLSADGGYVYIAGGDAGVSTLAMECPLPVAAFSWTPAHPFVNESVSFEDSSQGEPTLWFWTFDDIDPNESSEQHPLHEFTQARIYNVCLIAKNSQGSDTLCLGVEILPEQTATFVFSPPRPVPGEPVQFTSLSAASPEHWRWTFGDGGESTAQHPMHAFEVSGEYTVCATNTSQFPLTPTCRKLTVVQQGTCGDGLCQLGEDDHACPADCVDLICGNALCQRDENFLACPDDCPAPICGDTMCDFGETILSCAEDCESPTGEQGHGSVTCTDCFLPAAAGGVAGNADSFWLSEAMAHNPADAPTSIRFTYSPDGSLPEKSAGPFEMAPHESWHLSNLVDHLFGETSNGSIRLSADLPIMINSRIFNDQENGTYGQSISAWSPEQALGRGEKAFIPGVQQNGDFRTNLLIQEISGVDASVLIELFDESGQAYTTSVNIAAHRKKQFSLAQLGVHEDLRGYITLDLKSGGLIVTLASVIDSRTGDPRTVHGVTMHLDQAGVPGGIENHQVVPVIARDHGESYSLWRTQAQLLNPYSEDQVVRLDFHWQHTQGPPADGIDTADILIPSLSQITIEDLVLEYFPDRELSRGSLHIYAPLEVIINSFTYNLSSSGTYGQNIPALAGGDLIDVGESGTLLNLVQTSEFRTNFGVTVFDDLVTLIELKLYALDSTVSAPRLVMTDYFWVDGMKNRQTGMFSGNETFGKLYPAALATVRVIQGGRVYAYASKIDNRTGDPTFIPAITTN